eukprot:PITA_05604
MIIISKVALNRGMDHFVLVVYRHAVATVVLAPFAFFFERPVIDQNLSYLGLKLTTPTYSLALTNVLPAMTFIMALVFRAEAVHIRELRDKAKIVGTSLSIVGAMMMTFCKGPIVQLFWSPHYHAVKTKSAAAIKSKDWVIGSLLMLVATLAWSGLFIIQATVLGVAIVRDFSKWTLRWDINLLSAVYAGVFGSAIAYYLQGIVIPIKGPVFTTAFTPLMVVITAIMGAVILSERIYLGSVLGGIVILIGLYTFLWGKAKDSKLSTDRNSSQVPLSNSQESLRENGVEDNARNRP